jgi:hypothetical protein
MIMIITGRIERLKKLPAYRSIPAKNATNIFLCFRAAMAVKTHSRLNKG